MFEKELSEATLEQCEPLTVIFAEYIPVAEIEDHVNALKRFYASLGGKVEDVRISITKLPDGRNRLDFIPKVQHGSS
jgi:hypothetical protein